jgi:hypothetical protein
MTLRAGLALAAAPLALAACSTGGSGGNNQSIDAIVTTGDTGDNASKVPATVTAVAPDGSALGAAATPMNERVAVVGLLNKRNGISRDVTLKPGEATRVGDVIIRLRACEKTAPWEQVQDTGAFVQLDVLQTDKSWKRVFSGWLYKDRPAANVVQHPIYDVWTKSCAMTFRDSGPDTVNVGSGPGGSSAEGAPSSAKKSPSTEATPAASPATDSPSAAPSNAT